MIRAQRIQISVNQCQQKEKSEMLKKLDVDTAGVDGNERKRRAGEGSTSSLEAG